MSFHATPRDLEQANKGRAKQLWIPDQFWYDILF